MAFSRLVAGSVTAALLFSLLLVGPGLAQEVTEEPPAEATLEATVEVTVEITETAAPPEELFTLYTVQAGDTLARIARRFNTTIDILATDNNIVNINTISVGQQLRIRAEGAPTPTATSTPIPPPVETAEPGPTGTYVVQPGDTLFRIATRFNTTVSEMLALNNLPNPNVIQVGQTLLIPGGEGAPVLPTAPPVATPDVEPSPVPVMLEPEFGRGIHVFASAESASQLAEHAAALNMDWVRVEVRWLDYEPVEGQINFAQLDAVLEPFLAADMQVLVTIAGAPDWARTSTDESGPPDNFQHYASFVGQVAERYAGRTDAYQIWSEPNLRREWNSNVHTISAESYIDLLQQAYVAIKTVDSEATVVSAGLAPTGFNDGVNAINDRVYLQGLYQQGLADVSDAIGAHPGGWANPPDSLCCSPAVGIETHYEDPSFYFLETLNSYRDIMVNAGDAATPIWVTEFGWGTSEDTDAPPATYVYVTYTSLAEQAIYMPRAFSLGQELGYVGPMFVYNLNGCQSELGSNEVCFYSLIGPDGTPRPVYNAIQALDQTGEPVVEETAPPAPEQPTFELPEPGQDPLSLTATQIITGATQEAATLAAPVVTEEAAQG